MAKHEIPRKKTNETRIFVIFSIRSLASTVIGAVVGFIIGGLITAIIRFNISVIVAGACAVLGFLIGTFPLFYIPGFPNTKLVEGEYLYQVIYKYIQYRNRRSLITRDRKED